MGYTSFIETYDLQVMRITVNGYNPLLEIELVCLMCLRCAMQACRGTAWMACTRRLQHWKIALLAEPMACSAWAAPTRSSRGQTPQASASVTLGDALATFGAGGIFDAAERQIRNDSKVHLLRATAGSALSSLLDLHSEAADTPGVNRGFPTDQLQRFSSAPGDVSHSV
jgi:hypothetical protein